jgi:hypothetical protein
VIRVIVVDIRTDDSGRHCAIDCCFLVGYTCDCFLKRVGAGAERERLPECIAAEIISKHKPKGGSHECGAASNSRG